MGILIIFFKFNFLLTLYRILFFTFHNFIFFNFFNYFLLKEISSKTNHEFFKYIYLFTLIFFNLSFNRLAEYGTDKAGQLLIVILIIKIFQFTCFEKNKVDFSKLLMVIPLLAFCMTLKTYFLPYIFWD